MSANAFGNGLYRGPWSGAAFWFGGRVRQPGVTAPLQVLVLIADSVSSPVLMANTVCSAWSAATMPVPVPVGTVGGVRPQPAVMWPLQAAPLMTDTDPPVNPLSELET